MYSVWLLISVFALAPRCYSYRRYSTLNHGGTSNGCRSSFMPPDPRSGCCGVDSESSNYILGGNKTLLRQYPWLALIEYATRISDTNRVQYDTLCGGTLISGRYVLTAAHCVAGEIMRLTEPRSVRLGEYDKTNDVHDRDCVTLRPSRRVECADPVLRVAIQDIFVHEEYSEKKDINDIALIRLVKLVYYTDFIRPICLPTTDISYRPPRNLRLYSAGWGVVSQKHFRSDTTNIESKVKRHVELPFKANKDCNKPWDNHIRKDQLCAGGKKGRGTCLGDSGGPLMHDRNGVWEIVGVVSYGTGEGCGTRNVPDIFTKVYAYRHWIEDNIGL